LNRRLFLAATVAALAIVPASAQAAPPPPDPQMKAVLQSLAELKPKPIEKLSPTEARKQPGPPDAVKLTLKKQGKPITPEPVAKVMDTKIPGAAGQIPARVYTPSGTGPFPVIVYYHGGGWVIAGINAYDASCRALCNAAGAVVVSVGYRLAPETKFPGQHEDSYAALQHVMQNAASMGGDPKKVAVVGESAGGNLATAVCLMARDRKGMMPVHQVLVYPITDTRLNTPSYEINKNAKPLNKPMMAWFVNHTIRVPADKNNKYLAVLRNPNVAGLPPATVITAEIDPLLSESKAYADKLKKAGVPVRYKYYDGVAHEFFGMGAVVDKAKDAVAFAATGLKESYSK
jgi:acetyl esterase/lipase